MPDSSKINFVDLSDDKLTDGINRAKAHALKINGLPHPEGATIADLIFGQCMALAGSAVALRLLHKGEEMSADEMAKATMDHASELMGYALRISKGDQ